jgi:hypothetical protein
MRLACLATSLLLLAPAARAAPPRLTLVACAPGYPGTTAEAQPHLDALAAALVRLAGWPDGALQATYLPGEQAGLARLAQADAALALVPLPFLLQHGSSLGLTARLQVATAEVGTQERWSLVARKGRLASGADLAGLGVSSIAGYAPAFVRGAAGPAFQVPASARVVFSVQVLSALRKAASSGEVAVLLDGAQARALPTLPFAGELEVVASSPPVPTALLATVGRRLPEARWRELERALLSLADDPRGAAALAGIRMVRFSPIDATALAAARRLAAEGAR